MMEGRRYSEGLHQALEAKEGVQIQQENQTLASITFQNYFRLYPKLAGMTGTAATEAAEFMTSTGSTWSKFRPTNRWSAKTTDDEVYRTADEKYDAILELLIGLPETRSAGARRHDQSSIESPSCCRALLKKRKIRTTC